ncbi:beta-lactamase superfamily domain-containing protein [Mycena belliarum]|uniref:Beta-lactamase superfamily domain-containing protein n=1 Tax=Mycena belliarum TaxID=1033014 RepID=A0AAD6TZX6_9AGAR|nr:beta-lactamase superfamily domain-containing protein [Mycena belliae]
MSESHLTITVTRLESRPPPSATSPPAHHVGSPPMSFCNPWTSYGTDYTLLSILQIRFGSTRNFVPVPASRAELVPIRSPDWGAGKDGLKATWIGHASFLVETSCTADAVRGVRVLLDPVFSERTSPVGFAGPKRFSPTPCTLEELPEVDVVAISHDHYDHLDSATIRFVNQRGAGNVRFLCPLGVGRHLTGMGVAAADVTELDWWDGVVVNVPSVGSIHLVCTPSQHNSGRSLWDKNVALWSSWVLEEVGEAAAKSKRVFFAGDTAYRAVDEEDPADLTTFPHCPAFAEIGELYGPFDLALLPIGCYSPRSFMSKVHCAPEDAVCIHRDIRSKRSIGMHYGTVRGGLSQQYEDVREPPRRWREACEREGLVWDQEAGLCDIGETVII